MNTRGKGKKDLGEKRRVNFTWIQKFTKNDIPPSKANPKPNGDWQIKTFNPPLWKTMQTQLNKAPILQVQWRMEQLSSQKQTKRHFKLKDHTMWRSIRKFPDHVKIVLQRNISYVTRFGGPQTVHLCNASTFCWLKINSGYRSDKKFFLIYILILLKK